MGRVARHTGPVRAPCRVVVVVVVVVAVVVVVVVVVVVEVVVVMVVVAIAFAVDSAGAPASSEELACEHVVLVAARDERQWRRERWVCACTRAPSPPTPPPSRATRPSTIAVAAGIHLRRMMHDAEGER